MATPRWGDRSHQYSAFRTFYSVKLFQCYVTTCHREGSLSKYCTEAKGQLCLHTNTLYPLCEGDRAHVLEQHGDQIDPRDRNKPYELFNKNAHSSPKHATLDGNCHLQLGKQKADARSLVNLQLGKWLRQMEAFSPYLWQSLTRLLASAFTTHHPPF